MTIAHGHRDPNIALERSWSSEVTAISSFVDKLMLLLRKRWVSSRPWHPHGESVLMDEVRFEEGGVVVHTRKSTGEAPKPTARESDENETI